MEKMVTLRYRTVVCAKRNLLILQMDHTHYKHTVLWSPHCFAEFLFILCVVRRCTLYCSVATVSDNCWKRNYLDVTAQLSRPNVIASTRVDATRRDAFGVNGALGRLTCNREVAGSSPGRSAPRNNSAQVVHTHLPLFTKQYKLVLAETGR